MKIRCEYCDNFIDDSDETCPHCGAPNAHLVRGASGVPKTIDQLRAFALAHNLPLEKMRFFLGEDYRGPRAFGIYKDEDGNFIVYKNKANGERAVRYRGKDEAYAVNELWQKMRTEVQNQKARLNGARVQPPKKEKWYKSFGAKLAAIFFAVLLVSGIADYLKPNKGYYRYDDDYYYYDSSAWYQYYPEEDDWGKADVGLFSDLNTNSGSYYESSYYSGGAQYEDFYSSDYYYSDDYTIPDDGSDWDDSDWDWDDGDSWDSDSTDWDSDW